MAYNLFEQYSQLDNGLNAMQLFDGGAEYQIACYIVPCALQTIDRFNRKNALYLQWGKDVEELNIYDTLMQFGVKGDMVVADNHNSLSFILEQFISFELVVNIVQKVGEDAPNLRYEPYIFNIIGVEPMTPPNEQPKKLKITFEDALTANAKKTSLGAFLKLNSDFKQIQSFPKAFETVIDYLKEIILANNNNEMEYAKGLKFNNYTVECKENSIIETILDKLDNDNTLYDLLVEMTKVACIAIQPDAEVTGNFEMIGDVLIPMFCKEEYTDMLNYYYTAYNEQGDNMQFLENEVYAHRPFSLRNFYMPFEQGFKKDSPTIFEAFSIERGTLNTGEKTINGINPDPIQSFESVSANMDLTSRRWKNMSFLSAGANGGSNRLVYFNWLYQFFNLAFLQGEASKSNVKVSNILPQFYLTELINPDLRDDKDLAEKNSNVYLIENEKADPLQEILMQMGKTIASLVLLNNSYSFEVAGSLLRRTNEIINLYVPADPDESSPSPLRTDLAMSKNVMLYITAVVHTFKGNIFRDKVICNRIYEKAEE